MNESEIQQRIQIEGPRFNCQLLRNNSGAFRDAEGRFVFFGLGNISKKHSDRIKSSDLIGFTRIVVTPDMVGRTVAIFTAVEVKASDWADGKKFNAREEAQATFIDWIRKAGGFAGFANSIESFKRIIGVI